MNTESNTGRVIENIAVGGATAIAGWGLLAACGAVASGPPGWIALGVGLIAAGLHSKTGSRLLDKFGNWADTKFSEAWKSIKDFGSAAWNGTKSIAKDIGDSLSKGYDYLADKAGKAVEKGKEVGESIGEGIMDVSEYIYDKLNFLVRQVFGTGAYKPNIYIYSDKTVDVTLRFVDPAMLTNVIPDYTGEWSVTAEGDGRLYLQDGSELGYLFYESETQPHYFQREEGFLVEADERALEYEMILTAYGFNETEIADFIDFWVAKLPEGVDYMMYPQLTDTIDMAMPVEITPVPEHIFRLWFAFEAYDGQDYREPEPAAMERDGYSIVEWGGVILDENDH